MASSGASIQRRYKIFYKVVEVLLLNETQDDMGVECYGSDK
jgi:hypothetical protein